jgi:hypothetical protein
VPHPPTRAAPVSAGAASRTVLVTEEAQEQLQAEHGAYQNCSPHPAAPRAV